MQVIKILGKVYGAKLTNAEREAMRIEIQKELAEMTRRHEIEMDAIILWELMAQLDLDIDALHKFYVAFGPSLKALIDRYELDESDDVWLCTRKLKDKGIDVEAWRKEMGV